MSGILGGMAMRMNFLTRCVRSGLCVAVALATAWACSSNSNTPATTAPAGADNQPTTEAAIQTASESLHAKLLAGYGGELPSGDVQDSVQGIARSLLDKAGMSDVNLYIVDSADANHFAIPGHIYLTRGLLVELDNEAQLAAAIENEASHLKLGQVRKKIDDARDKAGNGFLGMFVPKYDAILAKAFAIDSDGHYGAVFSDSDEYDAAKDAIPRMAAAAYDPKEYPAFLQRMLDSKAGAVATHSESYAQVARAKALEAGLIHTTPDSGWRVGADTYKTNVVDKIKSLPAPATQKS